MARYGGCVSVRKTVSTYLCSSIGARAAAAAGFSWALCGLTLAAPVSNPHRWPLTLYSKRSDHLQRLRTTRLDQQGCFFAQVWSVKSAHEELSAHRDNLIFSHHNHMFRAHYFSCRWPYWSVRMSDIVIPKMFIPRTPEKCILSLEKYACAIILENKRHLLWCFKYCWGQ